MAIGSDNPFPSMLYVEGTTPASPSAGRQRLFVRSSDHVLCMVNSSGTVTALSGALANPMTTKGDVILGDTGGTPTRLGAGTSGYVLTSAGAAAFPVWAAASAATPTILLDYTLGSDISALSVTASTWTDIISNQNFTKATAGSVIEIAVRCFSFINGAGGQGQVASRIVVDSAGTPITENVGGSYVESSMQRSNPFAGTNSIYISGLSAAVHTVKPQVFINGSNSGFYCRPTGAAPNPVEFLRIQVIEHL